MVQWSGVVSRTFGLASRQILPAGVADTKGYLPGS
jgi:hypothetical protein